MILKLVTTLAMMLVAAAAFSDSEPAKNSPQFLYRVQPSRPAMLTAGPTPEEAEIVAHHFNYLKGLTAKGVLILAGRTQNTDETSFGVIIFRAESEEAARAIMNADPAVAKGVFRATLFPYKVALMEGQPVP
ncbi:MAG: YciI family protein [Acidobacteria bacterium]|nr:YciI family protein [Acidobacteriota bacterium]